MLGLGPEFSDYIVYADESGSPVLEGIDPDYPVFVLLFLLVKKSTYARDLAPQLQQLKFDFVGHDQLIFHERDIRRQSGAFAFLQTSAQIREAFLQRISELVDAMDAEIIVSVIRKETLKLVYHSPWSPYHLALQFCLERLRDRLLYLGQKHRRVHCIFESRGKKEDEALELEFSRVTSGNGQLHDVDATKFLELTWHCRFADKKSNSAGLQLADLMARPTGLRCLRPSQPNAAAEIILKKIAPGGFKTFP